MSWPWSTCWGCGKDSRTPNLGRCRPRRTAAVPQRRQFYTTRCEQTVCQRMDPQTRESKAVNSQPKPGVPNGLHPGARARTGQGHLKKGEGYLHRCRSAPLPGVGCSYVPERGRCRLRPQRARPLILSPHPCSRWSLVLRQGAVRTLQGIRRCRVRPAHASHSRTDVEPRRGDPTGSGPDTPRDRNRARGGTGR